MSDQVKLAENTHFSATAENKGPVLVFTLSGVIDEEVNLKVLQDFAQKTKPRELHFDLAKVTRINSVGLRAWILFVDGIQKLAPIVFEALSAAMIEQANFVPNALGKRGARVLSFSAPYFCPACNLSQSRMLATADVISANGAVNIPEQFCSQCKGKLDFDAIEEEFLTFARSLSSRSK